MGHRRLQVGCGPFQAIASIPAKNLMKERIDFSLSSRNPHSSCSLSHLVPFLSFRYVLQHVSRRLINHLKAGEIWKVSDLLRPGAVCPLHNLLKASWICGVGHEANFTSAQAARRGAPGRFCWNSAHSRGGNCCHKLGFQPFIHAPELFLRWRSVFAALGREALEVEWPTSLVAPPILSESAFLLSKAIQWLDRR
jgi:hypothetical protein